MIAPPKTIDESEDLRVRDELERILASQTFRPAEAQKKFLRYVVDLVAGCDPNVGTVNEWFNPACFTVQPVGTLGSEGRNMFTLPGVTNFDLALLKDTRVPKISENFAVQFRAEFFNILNHANFGPPAVGDFVKGTAVRRSAGRPAGLRRHRQIRGRSNLA